MYTFKVEETWKHTIGRQNVYGYGGLYGGGGGDELKLTVKTDVLIDKGNEGGGGEIGGDDGGDTVVDQ